MAAAFGLLVLGGILAFPAAAKRPPKALIFLETRTLRLEVELKDLSMRMRSLSGQVNQLSTQINKMKTRGDLSFLERRRLERLLAEFQDAGERLERLVPEVEARKRRYDLSLRRTYQAYTREMVHTVESLSAEKSRQKLIVLTNDFNKLRRRREKFRPPGTRFAPADFLGVPIQEGDSTEVLKGKLEILIKRRKRLAAGIVAINKEIRSLKRDLGLSRQINALINENNLFDESIIFDKTSPDGRGVGAGEDGRAPGGDASETGIHVSPLDSTGPDSLGDADRSIEVEITRLIALQKYMLQAQKNLGEQIRHLRKLIRDMKNSPVPRHGRRGEVHGIIKSMKFGEYSKTTLFEYSSLKSPRTDFLSTMLEPAPWTARRIHGISKSTLNEGEPW